LYHLFDRITYDYIGYIAINSNGGWLDPAPSTKFPRGAFYAIYDDGNATAFSLSEIAVALDLD
jgi:3-phytase